MQKLYNQFPLLNVIERYLRHLEGVVGKPVRVRSPLRHHGNNKRDFGLPPESLFP
jgi:hypothetical protein